MHRKFVFSLLALSVALLFLLSVAPSQAQTYSFTLGQEEVDVWINRDGSARLEYWFTLTCDQGDHIIEAVDVGMPTSDFSGMSADIGGQPASIGTDFQGQGSWGFAVHLGAQTIEPGQTGTVHVVVARVGGMVYQDTSDPSYASSEFSPAWFGSSYVHGTSTIMVRFHLPPGVQASEPRWHQSPSGWPSQPQSYLDADGRIVYDWENSAAAPDQQYTFGASFPSKYVEASAIQENPPSGGGSGILGVLGSLGGVICSWPAIIIGVIVLITAISWRSQAGRRMKYLPPSMQVEGVGIKRGLTAVEAAILLETPLNKILTMILFGLLKKGAVTVLNDNPLQVQVNQPLPEGLHPYEADFVAAIHGDTLDEAKLRTMMVDLVKSVNTKMKGFSRKESVAYYQDIVKRAWQQVEAGATPEVRGQLYSDGLEWTMLDDKFEDRTERTFRGGPVFVPIWWGYYLPWARTMPAGTPAPAAAPAGGPVRMPSLPGSDFAARMVRGIQGTAGSIVHNLTGFTGGVAQVTNPVPKTSYSGGGHSSGGSCVCACACACAGCACACAGGGR
jgi:hypothetical protein